VLATVPVETTETEAGGEKALTPDNDEEDDEAGTITEAERIQSEEADPKASPENVAIPLTTFCTELPVTVQFDDDDGDIDVATICTCALFIVVSTFPP
jgi:hypothetical protein